MSRVVRTELRHLDANASRKSELLKAVLASPFGSLGLALPDVSAMAVWAESSLDDPIPGLDSFDDGVPDEGLLVPQNQGVAYRDPF